MLAVYLLATTICGGQTTKNKILADSSTTISRASFENLVDNSLKLMQTKKLSELTGKEHVDIMMCLNTIFVQKLSGRHYQTLETIAKEKEYSKNITNIYPEWIPNKGMGFYFKKIKMELYESPEPSSYYKIKN